MSWVVRFVDGIQTTTPAFTPTTRLDLNSGADTQKAGTMQVQGDAVDFGVPEFRRTQTGAMSDDGDRVVSEAYGNRNLIVPVLLFGTADQASVMLQKIAREMDRPRNFLQVRPHGSAEIVTFRTLRSSIASQDVRDAGVNIWRVILTILAEPFALGAQELFTSTTNNDPGASAWELPTIKGDVSAPLRLSWRRQNSSNVLKTMESSVHLLHSIATTAAFKDGTLGYAMQHSGLGTDTTTPASDATAFGSNYARTTFATDPSLNYRTSFTSGLSWPRGLYRAMVRVRTQSGAGNEFVAQLYSKDASSAAALGDTKTWTSPNDNVWQWLDLGLLNLPLFTSLSDPQDEFYAKAATPGVLYLYLGRNDPAGSVDTDCLMLLPIEVCNAIPARTGFIRSYSVDATWPDVLSDTTGLVIDTDTDSVRMGGIASTQLIQPTETPNPEVSGGLPRVYPGYVNTLLTIGRWSPPPGLTAPFSDLGNIIADKNNKEASYYPRYLMLRPVGA